MLHISLFSGIGGFDLASELMGWQNIASCEINPFGRKVLEYYWPNAYHHDDIKTLTYTKLNEELTKKHGANWRADDIVLTGGFPCQPYSLAGKRLGNEDERHLWPEMLRVIREVSPKWIVGENVFGLVNWSEGLVFNEVQTDLEALGYEVQSYVLPACAVNAPHRRDRIFIVAHTNKYRYNANGGAIKEENGLSSIGRPTMESGQFNRTSNNRPIAHTNNTGGSSRLGEIQGENGEIPERHNDAELGNADAMHPNRTIKQRKYIGQKGEGESNRPNSRIRVNNWAQFPTQSPICSRNDGLSARLDGITFSKWRNESIKAGGNAVVPPLIYNIFKSIQQYEDDTRNHI